MGESEWKKSYRIIYIYEVLNKGEVINKKLLAQKFNVYERTIQRDIDELREYLSECSNGNIVYSRAQKGYVLKKKEDHYLTNEEILALSKVLLESRAFPKNEMDLLLDKLILQSSASTRKNIEEVIKNEKFHFVPLTHSKPLLDYIWELSSAVRTKKKVELSYSRLCDEEAVKRIVNPVGIIFSEFYFYLIAYIDREKYDFPAIFRIDRINDYKILDERFYIEEKERFEEGEYRKLIQFMYAGELLKIKFKFYGQSIEAVLDRLPNARVLHQDDKSALIEAQVFGKGIKRWILSQMNCIEVLEPAEFREEMKRTIEEMNNIYK